jgi:hypothetical protein
MWVRVRTVDGSDIFAGIVVFLAILGVCLLLFFYVGIIALAIFLGIGVCIAGVYALIVYIRALVDAIRMVGVGGYSSFGGFLKNWATVILTASGNAFKQNVTVAGNALGRAHNYRLLSFRHWMWFIVAPATIIMGTVVILAVILLHIVAAIAVAILLAELMLVYLALAFVCACGYSLVMFFKNLFGEDLGRVYAFNFSLSSTLPDFAYASKQFFTELWAICVSVWKDDWSMGTNNRSYASNYKIIMPQYVFLTASLITMPFISTIFDALVLVVGCICYIFLALANFFWTLLAMLITKIHP